MKLLRKFEYGGQPLMVVERDEPYMNGGTVSIRRVISPSGKRIPIDFSHRITIKKMISETITFLDGLAKNGADVVSELKNNSQPSPV